MTADDLHISRRAALAASAAGLAVVLSARGAGAAPVIQSGGGIAGGGSLKVKGGHADFSLFGSRFAVEGSEEPLIFGQLTYVDKPADVTMLSLTIDSYGPVGGDDNARAMTGTLSMNGTGSHPFTITATDNGAPEAGEDTIDFAVGDDGAADTSEPIYGVTLPLDSGDVQLLTFAFPE